MERATDFRGGSEGRYDIVLHSAPLNVGVDLDEQLFSKKRSVVLTSATLGSQGTLDYMRDRVGLQESEELMVGSPFDYKRAAVILIPKDIPAPTGPGFQPAADRLVVGLARELEGRMLVLFTSHAALRATAKGVRSQLEAEGIRVLAQGVDGSARQIVQEFGDSPSSVILGTSSLWEGVDLAGGILKAVVIGRLPFHVPTDPIFAARSGQYEDGFREYALPQAVLRLRQGIGRLIRGSQDRGVIVVLDNRIISRAYGRAFLESMPACTVKQGPMSSIPEYAGRWVRREATV
jgi:DNA polymerase-3 subunit epsilon/ATP-dependent DNA helicase DinG